MIEKTKMNRMLLYSFATLLLAFVCVLFLQCLSMLFPRTKETCSTKVCLRKMLKGPPVFNDPYMARYIQDNYITTSGSKTLNLANYDNVATDSGYNTTKNFLQEHFKGKRDGRFVVLGAGDGEFLDFTLDLEVEQGWTGLLIEPNPILFEELKKKGRKAEISNACVSPFTYPSKVSMKYPKFNQKDNLAPSEKYLRYRETKLGQLVDSDYVTEKFSVQCFPLTNILYSARTIGESFDLLIMDMTGTDLDILAGISLESLPKFEMVVMMGHGKDIGSDIAGFFLERNMVRTKTFGNSANDYRFIITKFKANEEQ